jgi:hypothetical protein
MCLFDSISLTNFGTCIKDRGKAVNAFISIEDKDFLQQQASEAQTRWLKGMH